MEKNKPDYAVLDVALIDILSAIAPSREDIMRRERFISELRDLLQSTLQDRANPPKFSLRLISTAKIPIIVYESTELSCDISINNHDRQLKSKYLLSISQIYKRFRELILLVKEWAKTKQINDAKQGLLSSYALCLLVIFHFQVEDPFDLSENAAARAVRLHGITKIAAAMQQTWQFIHSAELSQSSVLAELMRLANSESPLHYNYCLGPESKNRKKECEIHTSF